MTGNAIKPKSEALELHELSSEQLGAVSGGDKLSEKAKQSALENQQKAQENLKQEQALQGFKKALAGL